MADEETSINLIYLAILGMITLSLILFINSNLLDDSAFRDKYLSKDISLLHDAAFVGDGEISLSIDLEEDVRTYLDTRRDCSVIVNAYGSFCGRYFEEQEKRDFYEGDKIVLIKKKDGVDLIDRNG